MKKFFLKLACFAVALAIPFGVYFARVQSGPWVYGGSLMGSARVKYRLVQDTPGPRILLAGGSNVPYAINSAAVEEALGMPCLNLGATVNLGLDFYLQMMKGNIHEGDIVVLMPEFGMWQNRFGYTLVWMAIENDWEMYSAVPPDYWPGMVKNFYNYAREKQAMMDSGGTPSQDLMAEYTAAGFGPWGDMTFSRGQEMDEDRSKRDPISLSPDIISADIIREINQFTAYVEKQGATVYLFPAPFCELAVTSGPQALAAFEARIRAACAPPLIGTMEDALMPLEYFYNSNNHLNTEGQTLRTARFVEALRAAGQPGKG